MNKQRHYVGQHNGMKYTLVRNQRGNQMACDPGYQKEWCWYLSIEDEYVGEFGLFSEAMDFLDKASAD